MSEKHSVKHERHKAHERHDAHNELNRLHHEQQEKAKHDAHEHGKKLDEARLEAAKHALESKQVEAEDSVSQLNTFAGHQLLKKDAYKQVLGDIRRRLPKRSRAFSKLVHNKTVETISEVSGKTIARPSGLLGAGIGAFIGSSILLYTSKHYGFSYNYGAFLFLFIGGFMLGLTLELLLKLFLKRRS